VEDMQAAPARRGSRTGRALEPVSEPTGGKLDGLPGRSEGRRPADQAAAAVPRPVL